MNRIKSYKKFALLLSLFLILTATVQTTFGLIVTKSQTMLNTFKPFENIVSGIIIGKTVEHPFGTNYVIPDNVVFDFQVELGAFYAGATVSTTRGDVVADENGIIIVSVKPGSFVGIDELDEGTKVTVTELQRENSGFAVKDGVITKETIVSTTETAMINYVNVYTPEKIQLDNINVTGTKILEGREWLPDDSFTFLLEQDSGDGNWTEIDRKTVSYNENSGSAKEFDFNDIIHELVFSQAGTYKFRISEIAGNDEDIIYDNSEKFINVIVGDADMDGKLEVQDVVVTENTVVEKDVATNVFNVAVEFTNKVTAPTETVQPTDTIEPTETIKPTESIETTEIVEPTETAKPTGTPRPNDSHSSQTGDDSQIALWIVMFILSAMILVMFKYVKRRDV